VGRLHIEVREYLPFGYRTGHSFGGDLKTGEQMQAVEKLRQQNRQFQRSVTQVAAQVYVAVGYAASNVGMIVGDGGIIIVDTTESTKAAELILAEFRKITALPVRAIIYTHGHRDHISGASVFAEGGSPEIVARRNFVNDLREGEGARTPLGALMARTRRQFGIGLKYPEERVNIGVGPGDRPMEGLGGGFMAPTKTFDGPALDYECCGVKLSMHAAPGETPDQMVVWLADRKVLFCADNFYHSFPNLYAIRGTRYRDYDAWEQTVDLMLSFDAEVLVTGHTGPVQGVEAIRERLTDYRDAIRFVIEKTIEGMNRGLTPDELAVEVRLPENLRDKPWLQEFYGAVPHAVRGYFSGTLGWFDGNPASLHPLAPADRAKRMAAMAGGPDRIAAAFDSAVAAGENQWALELSDLLLVLDHDRTNVLRQRAALLREMADATYNSPTRNYYISCAAEIEKGLSDG
jgi:alkyl sulfatase BDS1-like metallo-beta-lactamase superfamily hydrolase